MRSSLASPSRLALTCPPQPRLFDLLRERGGYYRCPKSPNGVRLGPLVGFTARYEHEGEYLQYIGEDYLNCAVLESDGRVLAEVSDMLITLLAERFPDIRSGGYVLCGVPEGGRSLATALALSLGIEHIYLEKVVVKEATAGSREVTELKFRRHAPKKGQRVITAEDITNNFSSTAQVERECRAYGADMVGIAALINRSPIHRLSFPVGEVRVPIIAIVNESMPEYRQDDPAVVGDVKAGNVAWSPKSNWLELMAAMRAFPS